ncbi:hypothetical protein LXA43DRAFT_977008 [Ganoderma leucocontextum]|nr:hypothetical protein LXA43DRAFT_977008 [Ganoderma leucocontextum]
MPPVQSKLQRSEDHPGLQSRWWRAGTGKHKNKWQCIPCQKSTWMTFGDARRHEQADAHQKAIEREIRTASQVPSTSTATPPPPGVQRSEIAGPLALLLEDSSQFIDHAPPYSTSHSDDPEEFSVDWEAVASEAGGTIRPGSIQSALSGLTQQLHCWMLGGDDSDSDAAERSESEEDLPLPQSDIPVSVDPLASGTRREQRAKADPRWFPWPDKETCILDIVRHLPRSLFSDKQMEIILWALDMLGLENRPSLFVLKMIDRMLQDQYGIDSIRFQGPLGHVYYLNDLAAILAQEMANPRVRPYLRFYPEDAGTKLKECWQASRWLSTLSPKLATPMVRVHGQDYYVYEPAKLALPGSPTVVPFRWYTRATGPDGRQELYGEAWRLHPVTYTTGERWYIVHEHERIKFAAASLSLSFPYMVQSYVVDDLPDPRLIIGRRVEAGSERGILPWTYTDPAVGNPWRARALRNERQHRVVSFPVWLYCDDTSGNQSKKWNKHNSWLFTPAGLPRVLAHQEANVHFLATSNIAPPLEMLHGIVQQLEKGQSEGIWAWDCEEQEMVLVIPVVLAILGDNPMQSEIACHVGLAGKHFCRICKVRGRDVQDSDAAGVDGSGIGGETLSREESATSASSDEGSGASEASASGAKKTKRQETMQELCNRARRFFSFTDTRDKPGTIGILEDIFLEASKVGGQSKAKKKKTEYGVKDTFQDTFTEKIFQFGRKTRGALSQKQKLLDAFIAETLPGETLSPVWRIEDLDPHKDTPVEILHVVLLGFVKYFWRDTVSARVGKKNKELLKTRLNSCDVSGLGFAPLSGDTLVTYAGSLTGRDFRVISQVAPFVLYDLVPERCYQTWLALSRLVPLIWQPEIDDLDEYLRRLEQGIAYFLDCTARWTPRWFNKPKFHILLHLVEHVRRFGPAILFATEGFESFNAVIRGKSVHSNRQAPSRDIATAFGRANRTRHLLSGGMFPVKESPHTTSSTPPSITRNVHEYSDDPSKWQTAGPLPLALARTPRYRTYNTIEPLLPNIGALQCLEPGTCEHLSDSAVEFKQTLTAAHLQSSTIAAHAKVWKCAKVLDDGGSPVAIGDVVLAQEPALGTSEVCVGRVREVLHLVDGPSATRADIVLVESFTVGGISQTYGLPSLRSASWKQVRAEDILCTMNVQHNCAGHSCTDTARVPVFQERERAHARAAIAHREKGDLILNLFQMRNARHLQRFRIEPQPLVREHAILEGAKAEIDTRKSQKAAAKGKRPLSHLRINKDTLGFGNVFGHPAREKTLLTVIRKKTSNARTSLRELVSTLNCVQVMFLDSHFLQIICSIAGKAKRPLEDMVWDALNKFKKGGAGTEVRNAFLFRFALLVRRISVLQTPFKTMPDSVLQRRWTYEDLFADMLVDATDNIGTMMIQDLEEQPQQASAPCSKKRKLDNDDKPLKPTVGKVPKGEDFWSKMEQHLATCVTLWGDDTNTTEWRE